MWDILNKVLNNSKNATPAPAADPTPVAAAPAPVADPVTVRIVDPNDQSLRPALIDTTVNSLAEAKDVAVWLTKGKDHTQPAAAMLLKDCTTDHLKNIILNKPNLSADYKRVIESLLTDRGETLPVVSPTPAPSTAAPLPTNPRDPNAPISDLNQIV